MDKELHCEWDTEPGVPARNKLKVRNEKLEGALTSLLEAFWYLQTRPLEEAQSFLEQVGSNKDISSLLDSLQSCKDSKKALAHKEMPWQQIGTQRGLPDSTSSDSLERSENTSSSITIDIDGNQQHNSNMARIMSSEHTVARLLCQPFVDAALSIGIASFIHYTGIILFISHLNAADQGVSDLLDAIKNAKLDWILEGTDANASNRKALLSEICGMAAVGLQYNSETLDQENPTSLEKIYGIDAYQVSKMLYSISKQFLDDAIESNPYQAMRICTLLVVYNIIEHASVAVAYSGMASSLQISNFLVYVKIFGPIMKGATDFLLPRLV